MPKSNKRKKIAVKEQEQTEDVQEINYLVKDGKLTRLTQVIKKDHNQALKAKKWAEKEAFREIQTQNKLLKK